MKAKRKPGKYKTLGVTCFFCLFWIFWKAGRGLREFGGPNRMTLDLSSLNFGTPRLNAREAKVKAD